MNKRAFAAKKVLKIMAGTAAGAGALGGAGYVGHRIGANRMANKMTSAFSEANANENRQIVDSFKNFNQRENAAIASHYYQKGLSTKTAAQVKTAKWETISEGNKIKKKWETISQGKKSNILKSPLARKAALAVLGVGGAAYLGNKLLSNKDQVKTAYLNKVYNSSINNTLAKIAAESRMIPRDLSNYTKPASQLTNIRTVNKPFMSKKLGLGLTAAAGLAAGFGLGRVAKQEKRPAMTKSSSLHEKLAYAALAGKAAKFLSKSFGKADNYLANKVSPYRRMTMDNRKRLATGVASGVAGAGAGYALS
jgi:hypothetical protein